MGMELRICDLRFTRAQEHCWRAVVRPRPVPLLGEQAVSQRVSVLGKVNEPDFGGTQIGTHPLWRKQGAEAGVEAEPIPTTQGALDQRTKLVHKAFGNEVFR